MERYEEKGMGTKVGTTQWPLESRCAIMIGIQDVRWCIADYREDYNIRTFFKKKLYSAGKFPRLRSREHLEPELDHHLPQLQPSIVSVKAELVIEKLKAGIKEIPWQETYQISKK